MDGAGDVEGAGGMGGAGDVDEVDRVDRKDRTDEVRGSAGPLKAPQGPQAPQASNGRPGGRRRAGGRRLAAALLALPVLAAAGLVLGAGQATAAALCPGRLVKTVTFSTGSLQVYKSRAYACAVTVAKKPGARREMKVSLQPRGGRAVVDQGKFTTRAGPVRVHALNRCVRASGSVGGSAGSTGWIGC
ncbi:hypothetical protein [Streptomyces halstedii]|uniref:hypothetical protein n=1 Tax=Streptomyces halstedii TaxID=1944 RepID=UPI003823FCB3